MAATCPFVNQREMHGYQIKTRGYQRETHVYQRETHVYQKETHVYQRETHGYQKETHGYQKETLGLITIWNSVAIQDRDFVLTTPPNFVLIMAVTPSEARIRTHVMTTQAQSTARIVHGIRPHLAPIIPSRCHELAPMQPIHPVQKGDVTPLPGHPIHQPTP